MDSNKKFKLRFMKAEECSRVSELVRGLQAYQKMKSVPRLPVTEDFLKELTHIKEEGARVGNNYGTFVVVAVDESRINEPNHASIVGYLIYTQAFCSIKDRHFYMNSFFIEEDYRKHGLGTKFMKFMKLHANIHGNNRVDIPFMNDNLIGQKFYQSFGSVLVNEEYEMLCVKLNDKQ